MNKLAENLPKGWRGIISQVTGFTQAYVSYVVLGNRPANSENAKRILEIAISLAQQNKRSQTSLKRKLAKL